MTQEKKEKAVSGKSIKIKKLLDYTVIIKNIPFILFLCLIAVLYIYNGHHYDKIVRKIAETESNLREQEYEYKNLKSKIIFRSKSSELIKAVVNMGLKEQLDPPVFITEK